MGILVPPKKMALICQEKVHFLLAKGVSKRPGKRKSSWLVGFEGLGIMIPRTSKCVRWILLTVCSAVE